MRQIVVAVTTEVQPLTVIPNHNRINPVCNHCTCHLAVAKHSAFCIDSGVLNSEQQQVLLYFSRSSYTNCGFTHYLNDTIRFDVSSKSCCSLLRLEIRHLHLQRCFYASLRAGLRCLWIIKRRKDVLTEVPLFGLTQTLSHLHQNKATPGIFQTQGYWVRLIVQLGIPVYIMFTTLGRLFVASSAKWRKTPIRLVNN